MTIYYDKITGGFHNTLISGERYVDVSNGRGGFVSMLNKTCSLPPDNQITAITQDEYERIFNGLSKGMRVVSLPNGKPTLTDKLPPTPFTKSEIEEFRLKSYSNPLTGSDRLFSESMRMQIMGESGFEEVRARAIARFEEIQAQYPWPDK
jgi:hypothetical protein